MDFSGLSVKADSVRLVISHVGYLPRILNQELTENLQLNIELQPETTGLDEIEVIAVGESTVEAIQMSQIKLPCCNYPGTPCSGRRNRRLQDASVASRSPVW